MVLPHVSLFPVFLSCCRSPLDKSVPPKHCHMAAARDVEELDAERDARQLRSSFYRAAKAERSARRSRDNLSLTLVLLAFWFFP